MEDSQVLSFLFQERKRGGYPLVQEMRTLASSEDKNGELRVPGFGRKAGKLLSYRIADEYPFSFEVGKRPLESNDRFPDPANQHSIGESWVEILLKNQSGNFSPGGKEDNRTWAVSSHSDNQVWLYATQYGQGFQERKGKKKKGLDCFQASSL